METVRKWKETWNANYALFMHRQFKLWPYLCNSIYVEPNERLCVFTL